ncbi:MAG: lipid A biosynthesis acyltransferase [Alphaproteobacteria bacterium]
MTAIDLAPAALEPPAPFQHRVEAAAFKLYLSHFKKMPFDKASAAGANWLSKFAPLTSKHTTMLRNLRLAFPNETETWREDVARGVWNQLGRSLGEFPHLHEITFAEGEARTEVIGREIFEMAKQSPNGAVFFSGHISNFELMPVGIVRLGVTCAMTYRAMNNKPVGKLVHEQRVMNGTPDQFPKGRQAGVGMMRTLRRGDAVAIMIDQKYNEGLALPFFGYDAMTGDVAARLALQYDAPLIPLSLRRVDGARFILRAHEPMRVDKALPRDQAVREASLKMNAFLEDTIRAAPEQWFWVHRRWPKEVWKRAGVF